MLKVSEHAIYDMAREVVAESPGYVYSPPRGEVEHPNMCMYVHGDQPGCVVGKILHRLGVPLAEFRIHEGRPASAVLGALLPVEGNQYRAGTFLDELQEQQDSGLSWAVALAEAEHHAPQAVAA